MADEPPSDPTAEEPAAEPPSEPTAEPAEPPAADTTATSLAAGVGLAFGGATENLQDVINVVFDVVQKQQVVIASTRAELDRQKAEHDLLKQQLNAELKQMRGDLAAAQRGEPIEETKPYSVVVGSLPPDHSNECMQKLLDEHEAETGEEHAVSEIEDPIHVTKWAAAHQVLHFDTAAAALRAVKALHGRAHHKGPPKPKAKPQTATFTAVGRAPPSPPVWKSTSASGALSRFSAMTRPSWLGRAARNRHRHAIEQASRRWRGGRRGDSARTRRKILISTQVPTEGAARSPIRGR